MNYCHHISSGSQAACPYLANRVHPLQAGGLGSRETIGVFGILRVALLCRSYEKNPEGIQCLRVAWNIVKTKHLEKFYSSFELTGIETNTVVPGLLLSARFPGLFMWMFPPCFSTARFTVARPRPVPSTFDFFALLAL